MLAAAFRSVLLPLKAIVMNTLSIAGAFGVLVWVFQDGHLNGFAGLTKLGYIESTMPVVIVCTLFGVSMDYEVFMLSRISEAYLAGASNRDAVAAGLVATGRIITSAASILVVVGLSFTTAERGDREGARPRPRACDRPRRDADPVAARAGDDARARRLELVAVGPPRR